MTDRLKKEDFIRLLAARMHSDEATATAWVDGIVETLYESFKAGKGVTLPGFGGFYVDEHSCERNRDVLSVGKTWQGHGVSAQQLWLWGMVFHLFPGLGIFFYPKNLDARSCLSGIGKFFS